MVSRFMRNPLTQHYIVAKRIMRYINYTLHYDLLFPLGKERERNELNGYSDVEWYGDEIDRRSITEYFLKFLEAHVS